MPSIPVWAVALVAFVPLGLAVVLGLGAVALRSCEGPILAGAGPTARAATSELPLSGTTKVELAAPGRLTIALGEPEVLRIDASRRTLARLTTEVRGDRLVIDARGRVRDQPSLHLTVKRLDGLTLAGSGDVVAPDLRGEEISVVLSGSGDLETGRVEAKRVRLKLVSSGKAKLQDVRAASLDVVTAGSGVLRVGGGEVEEQRIVVNGSGEYEARQLSSTRATATINGSGALTLWARDSLQATISGSGRIAYRGRPAIQQRIAGSGSVEALGE